MLLLKLSNTFHSLNNLALINLEMILRSYLSDESLNLAEYHRDYFQLASEEAISFNKDQRIILSGSASDSRNKANGSLLGL